VRRTLALVCTAAVGLTGVALGAPAAAATAPQSEGRSGGSPVQAVLDELVVGYVPGASADQRARARGRAAAHVTERVVAGAPGRREVELVRLPQGKDRDRAIDELLTDPAVAYAEPNQLYRHQAKPGSGGSTVAPDGFSNGSLWGIYGDTSTPANAFGSQAAEAWAKGSTGSSSVYVGVIDEGLQVDHPDLAGQVWVNPADRVNGVDDDGNGYVDDVHGWDFASGDRTVYDGGTRGSTDDHGTHVAGTIGAVNEAATDVPVSGGKQVGVVGVSQDVTLISGKFLGRNGGSLAAAVKAVDYFTDLKTRRGIDVVATNNSWGGGAFSQALFDAIARADEAEILFIAAAGNNGTDNDATASYPSSYALPNVIAVAAIDKTGGLASFSQYGATTVDLGAPGVGILSTTAYSGWSTYSGTSMATPHVTGAAALYAASNPSASASEIKAAILEAAVATPSLQGKTLTGGRLDASGF